jgi:Domain of unknown function (DUF1918)
MIAKGLNAPPHAGDWITVDVISGGPARKGLILEVLGQPGHEHYRVRWDEQHESLHFPAQGTRILHTPARDQEHP